MATSLFSALSPMAQNTFHPFPRLPIELRWKIWGLALPGPRTVELRISNNYRVRQHDFVTSEFPTILHVCRESRTEAKKSYMLAFHSPKYSIPVYFNFKKDTLYLRARPWDHRQLSNVIQLLPQKELIQRLAMSADLWPGRFSKMVVKGLGPTNLFLFPALKEIIIYQDIDTLGTHSKPCVANISCCLDRNQIKFGAYLESYADKSLQQVKLNVEKFLGELRGGKWEKRSWTKEPRFVYKALCEKGIPDSSFSCPRLRLPKSAGSATR